ncbi:TPA: accessory Sec system glycosyltransferase GtfA [Staphylococcus aureus]|nr:accessory Sec system glycosyltransferase GtfA [Staphylococcus aureus]HDI7183812.1 accessory Sec system glycosyltransferase GtfA [Staphylococcus aureus]HDI7189490.1 accessory Sec system glycosyltransferase GtfA [Staphylococcus aureus]HDI7192322.1 accessory Sec system glycosyltransferase GtfA [Staphylococcus aureus]HDI7195195.1 accessory Sec system glycosyltransferase GtfA [Staphylococcus aureus]
MTIYNINFGIGWASSGVEYAQAYRAKLLRRTNQDTKFVFLDFIQSENIQTLTQNIGFKDQEVIWLYQYFSDISIAPTTYTLDDIERELGHEISFRERNGKIVRLYFNRKSSFVTCYLQNEQKDVVDRAEFVINSMLVRKDFYSYTRIFSEYYAPADNKAKLYMRQFYNEDGSIAYNEYIDGDSSIYVFEDAVLYNKTEFIAYFLQRLNLTRDDIVILDRASDIGQAVLQHKGDSKVGVVIHADHYSNNMMSEQHILWNNYYEYQFSKAKYIDFFITATDIQNHMVCRQFEQYQGYRPRVYTIPVGSIDALSYPKLSRKPYAMISASRLANEKHIDWLVKAVIVAKRQVPELTFDIYGEGSEKTRLRKIIDTHRAQDYIRLLGHVKLDEIYNDYELFLSASTSEGFGLTLMEAVGSGLGMIGLNVNYGNPTFIRDGENGYLVPFDTDEDSVDDVIAKLAHAIVMYFNNGPQAPHDISYEVAQQFMTQDIILKWETLVQEVLHD